MDPRQSGVPTLAVRARVPSAQTATGGGGSAQTATGGGGSAQTSTRHAGTRRGG
jgi:hypothetical protein